MKKLSLWLVVLSMLMTLLPGTMVSAANVWFDVEVENGTPTDNTQELKTYTVGDRTYMLRTQFVSSCTGTENTFNAPEGKYDVWAAVACHTNGQYLCTYTFTLDGTTYDRISAQNANTGTDGLYGMSQQVAAGYTMTMMWVKVASGVELTAAEHSLTAEITGGTSVAGNRYGAMDVVRFVPSDWNWIPSNNFDDPEKVIQDNPYDDPAWEGIIHLEAETGEIGGGAKIVDDKAASGGKYVARMGVNGEPGGSVVEFTTDEQGTYDVWAAIARTDRNNYGGGDVEFVGGYEFTLDEEVIFTSDIRTTEIGTNLYGKTIIMIPGQGAIVDKKSAATVFWVKVAPNVSVGKGSHALKLYTKHCGHYTGIIDCVRFIPTGYTWDASDFTTAPVPGTPGGDEPTEVEYVHAEAEDAVYGSIFGEVKSRNEASGGKYLALQSTVPNSGDDTTVKFTVDVPQTGKYDLWILAGYYDDASGYWTATVGGSEYKQVKKTGAGEIYKTNDALGYTPHVQWINLGQEISMTGGSATVELKATAQRTDYYFQVLDAIRLVPSNWSWSAGTNLDAPEKPEIIPGDDDDGDVSDVKVAVPDENGIIDIEAEDGVLSGSMKVHELAAASKGKYTMTQGSRSSGSTTKVFFKTTKNTTYNIWAAVAVPAATGDHLGGYSFILDDAETAMYSRNHSGTDRGNPDLYDGIQLWPGDTGAGGKSTVKWIKVTSGKTISAGEHTITAEIICNKTYGNYSGAIDCFRLIPTGMEWDAEELPDVASARKLAEEIKKTYFAGDYSAVTESIELPKEIELPENASVAYESDKPEVIAADGSVTRPYFDTEDATVNFYICATFNDKTVKLPVEMKVPKKAKYAVTEFAATDKLTANELFVAYARVALNAAADSKESGKCALVAALYNADGSLAAITMDSATVTSKGAEPGVELPMPEDVSGCYVKVYIMNGLEMANQLAEVITVR